MSRSREELARDIAEARRQASTDALPRSTPTPRMIALLALLMDRLSSDAVERSLQRLVDELPEPLPTPSRTPLVEPRPRVRLKANLKRDEERSSRSRLRR